MKLPQSLPTPHPAVIALLFLAVLGGCEGRNQATSTPGKKIAQSKSASPAAPAPPPIAVRHDGLYVCQTGAPPSNTYYEVFRLLPDGSLRYRAISNSQYLDWFQENDPRLMPGTYSISGSRILLYVENPAYSEPDGYIGTLAADGLSMTCDVRTQAGTPPQRKFDYRAEVLDSAGAGASE